MTTMFCWQARGSFAEALERGAGAGLERHLASCGSCRAEIDDLRRVASLLAASARLPVIETFAFEEEVLREGRARLATRRPEAPRIAVFARPVPLGAALSIMLAAVLVARFFHGLSETPATPAASGPPVAVRAAAGGEFEDRVVPPREIPFVVREDLIGARRGRIPLTTYVLEPAPDESGRHDGSVARPVVRASL